MERLEEVPQATPGFGAWLEPGDLGVRSGNHLDIGFLDFGICFDAFGLFFRVFGRCCCI